MKSFIRSSMNLNWYFIGKMFVSYCECVWEVRLNAGKDAMNKQLVWKHHSNRKTQ